MRRLPIYFLVDTSESMRGEPIESVKNGLQLLVAALRKDPQTLETACLSIVTCGGYVEQLLPLTAIESVQIPDIVAQGRHCIGAGLELLCDCRIREVVSATNERKGDWLPLVFFLTDGTSDDDVSHGLERFHALNWGSVVSCAMGPGADRSIMSRVSGEDRMVELSSVDQTTLSAFFVWRSQVPCSNEMEIGHCDEDNELWCKRVWDGRYFQCEGCHEIYAYTLKKCPYCGGACSEVLLTNQ